MPSNQLPFLLFAQLVSVFLYGLLYLRYTTHIRSYKGENNFCEVIPQVFDEMLKVTEGRLTRLSRLSCLQWLIC